MGKSNFKGCIDAPPHIFLQLTPSGKAQKISTRTTEHCQSPSWGWGAGRLDWKARGEIRIRVGVVWMTKGIELRKGTLISSWTIDFWQLKSHWQHKNEETARFETMFFWKDGTGSLGYCCQTELVPYICSPYACVPMVKKGCDSKIESEKEEDSFQILAGLICA